MLQKVKQFVDGLFKISVYPNTPQHLQRTLECILLLRPDADEAVQIAAYSHDLARAFAKNTFENKAFDDPQYLAEHQEIGAKAISEFLLQQGYEKNKVDRVYNMVRHHEEGGDEESNILMDADSVSYLLKPTHLRPEFIQSLGKEKVKTKLEYMFGRIHSNKAKEIAKPLYEKALEDLRKI
ncbi:MAG: DUF4202 family protein [Candidatus Buchananbacteria bacterium]